MDDEPSVNISGGEAGGGEFADVDAEADTHAAAVVAELGDVYWEKTYGGRDAFECLVRTVLSQNTSDVASQPAHDALLERYDPAPGDRPASDDDRESGAGSRGDGDLAEALRDAHQDELAETISAAGLYNQKSETLIRLAGRVCEEYGVRKTTESSSAAHQNAERSEDVDPEARGELFRESVDLLRTVWREEFPEVDSVWGTLDGDLDVVPKPTTDTVPLLPTGHARQEVEWIAEHGDGWFFYHLPMDTLESYLADWREAAGDKPYAMAVRTELADDPTAGPEPIHLGYRAGTEWFAEYFHDLDAMGVDHVLVSPAGDDPASDLTRFAEGVVDEVS